MSIPGSTNPLLLFGDPTGGQYQIQRSLRFNSSDSAYLSKTFSSSATSSRKLTYSTWVKRAALDVGSVQHFGLSAAVSGSSRDAIRFSGDSIQVYFNEGASGIVTTNAVFRDLSAWYHIVISIDTTNSTPADRVIIYVNGSRQSTSGTQPSQNYDFTGFLVSGKQQNIGRNPAPDYYVNAYLADVFLIDGQALTPSSFTEVSATTGQLIPKAYTGTFGTNGFWLKFSDNSALTSGSNVGVGKDYSGNANYFNTSGLSVTAGAGNDSLVDTPTSYGTDTYVGGEVRGNYCTWNPLDQKNSNTFSNGNLDCVIAGAGEIFGTQGVSSGKWYFEIVGTATADFLGRYAIIMGVCNLSVTQTSRSSAGSWLFYTYLGTKISNGVETSYGNQAALNAVVGVAVDLDNSKIWFSVNNTWQASGDPAAGTNAAFTNVSGVISPVVFNGSSNSTNTFVLNTGSRAFAYTAPSGFKALCDTNLGAPLVAKPSTVFDVITYTGTGSSLTLPNGSSTPTSISFTPDFAWLKGRSGATNHALYDAVRGVQKDLVSNSTSAETTETTGLTAFGTNTFTVGSLAKLNTSSSTYVAWAWNAGGTTDPSNTAGSITSQVRANVSAGFSVVGWTSNGTFGIETTGHGLGVSPDLIIVKNRDSGTDPWQVFHSSFSNTASDYLFLNTTAAKATSGATIWTRSSTTFGYRQSSIFTNGQKGIAYCFAPVVGYSSFGSYTGNGSADGPFVYTGFRPRWIMVKRTDSAIQWTILDTSRSPNNVADARLFPNLAQAETVNGDGNTDLLSNGFKPRNIDSSFNTNGGTYIFAAFAENPFQYARAR